MVVTIELGDKSFPIEVNDVPLAGDEIVLTKNVALPDEEQYFGLDVIGERAVVMRRQLVVLHECGDRFPSCKMNLICKVVK